jgi:Family of unknown function (DUF6011)
VNPSPKGASLVVTEPPAVGVEIFFLFEHAISHSLKYPRIRLLAEGGQVVIARRAGSRSRYEGQIQITDDGQYPYNTYFGRIDSDGVLHESSSMTPAVRELLGRFAASPTEVAFEYGQITGQCCFCDLPLSDARSLAHGYGPVCAVHYSLPWNANRRERGFIRADVPPNGVEQLTQAL